MFALTALARAVVGEPPAAVGPAGVDDAAPGRAPPPPPPPPPGATARRVSSFRVACRTADFLGPLIRAIFSGHEVAIVGEAFQSQHTKTLGKA